MREIQLTKGYIATVDDCDFEKVAKYKWQATIAKKKDGIIVYASTHVRVATNKRKHIRLHRLILNTPDGVLVDHEDGNGLNNRRYNLRVATPSQNTANSTPYGKHGLKGVSRRPDGRWRARITVNNKTIALGDHRTKEDAARAYDLAALKFFGEFAKTNFPREDYGQLPLAA